MKKKRLLADVLLIGGLLLIGLISWMTLRVDRAEGAGVSVCVDGVEIARYSLSVEGTYPLNGGSNILLIENGTARVTEANCPDALCVHQGEVHYTGQCITCLPNRLTVTVYGGSDEVELFS